MAGHALYPPAGATPELYPSAIKHSAEPAGEQPGMELTIAQIEVRDSAVRMRYGRPAAEAKHGCNSSTGPLYAVFFILLNLAEAANRRATTASGRVIHPALRC